MPPHWPTTRRDALDVNYAIAIDDLREAVTTLEVAERIARRVLGSSNPVANAIKFFLREARVTLARETPSPAGNA